ncbi:MAG: hypothetical protein EOM80_12920, partial [Erysipelotrichia bacterium]|nr:hypothetical protein [Erysipelotrichia bacterium]
MNELKKQTLSGEALQNLVPQIIAWIFNLVWLTKIFWQQHSLILTDSIFDGCLLALIFVAGFYKKRYSGFLPAFCMLSYEIHAQSALRVENMQSLYVLSWLVCTLLVYRSPARACSLSVYHASLSFDPGSAATAGIGMQVGFSAVPVTLMFICVFARELWNNRLGFIADSRHFAVMAALAWLLLNHHQGFAADLTGQFVAFTGSVVLLHSTFAMASCERERIRHIHALAAGGTMLIVAAFFNQMLEAGTVLEFFSRRAYAGALHPNHIACWCLATIWAMLAASKDFSNIGKKRLRFFTALFIAMIVLTGARLIIAVAVFGLLAQYLHAFYRSRKSAANGISEPRALSSIFSGYISMKTLLLAALLLLIGGRIFYQFDWYDLLRNERLCIWRAAVTQIAKAPFAGHGVLAFAMLPQIVDSDMSTWVYDWNYPHTHQGFLELLLWGGVPLLLLFIWSWLQALLVWKHAGFVFGICSVSITILADFSWRTPAMVVLAVYFLLFPARYASKSHKVGAIWKLGVLVPLMIASVPLMSIHIGHLSYDRALSAMLKGQETWKIEINRSVALLPFSLDVQMQRLLWKLSRQGIDEEFKQFMLLFREKFNGFWPARFVEGRYLELTGNYAAAFELYVSSLNLEPVDLSGIRNARSALLAYKLNDERFAALFANALARGDWGVSLLLNHPQYREVFRQKALEFADSFVPQNFFAAVKLAKILKNLAASQIITGDEAWKRLDNFSLPPWLLDEAFAARYMAEYKAKSANADGNLQQNDICIKLLKYGSCCLRTLSWIKLEEGDYDGFYDAYRQMLSKFNFRSKNYEELVGQFIFARASIAQNKHDIAVEMLEKLLMFDSGNPFIFELIAQSYFASNNREEALRYVNQAKILAAKASLEPFYREEPRNNLWPQGDQWVFL